jgi:hypothetical protein
MWSATSATPHGGHGLAAIQAARAAAQAGPYSSRPAANRSSSAPSRCCQARHGSVRKPGTNVTITIPPVSRTRASTSSGTLRGWSHSARALEWEKNAGAVDTSSVACMVLGATCERSASMPSRLHSRTTSRPNPVSPPTAGTSVALSAHGVFRLCVSVR